jgi:hypothetical protein
MKNLIENKKGMLPRNWIIIGVLISMIFISAGTWISTWSDIYYQNDTTQDYGSTYNYISNLTIATEPLEGYIQSDKKQFSLGFLDFITIGAYNVVSAIISIPKIFFGLIKDAGAIYGIPQDYIDGFFILLTVSVIFGILGVVFRRKT